MFSMQTGAKLEHHLFSGSVPVDIVADNKNKVSIDKGSKKSFESSDDIIEV